jgi:magnesium-transporting ATPase (P-type)
MNRWVPDTIEKLRAAGINVWVLTGDKQVGNKFIPIPVNREILV